MKKNMMLLTCLLLAVTVSAQKENWKEMHAFHSVMSATFHPSEQGNLQPARDSIDVLVAKARAWKNSPVPNGYKKEETAETLAALLKQCETIKEAVAKKANDENLKGMMVKAHDLFHRVMEKCKE